jgi:hypothetical protein
MKMECIRENRCDKRAAHPVRAVEAALIDGVVSWNS